MEYSQFFFTLFCMVAFCLGLNQIMSEGNLLYFLRKPFEGLKESLDVKTELYNSLKKNHKGYELLELESAITWLKIKLYVSKPLVLCITCFASVWGGSVFVALNGLTVELLPYLIVSCVSSAFIQTLIYVKADI